MILMRTRVRSGPERYRAKDEMSTSPLALQHRRWLFRDPRAEGLGTNMSCLRKLRKHRQIAIILVAVSFSGG
jgi:hypothetical protein